MKKYVHLGVCVFVAWVTLHVMWPVHHTWTLSQVKDNTTGCYSYSSNGVNITVNQSDSLSGLVKEPNGNLVIKGTVYLFQQKTNHVGVADSTSFYTLTTSPAGYFTFPNLFYGDYYIKVAADSATYPTTVGTYYTHPVKLNAFNGTRLRLYNTILVHRLTIHYQSRL